MNAYQGECAWNQQGAQNTKGHKLGMTENIPPLRVHNKSSDIDSFHIHSISGDARQYCI